MQMTDEHSSASVLGAASIGPVSLDQIINIPAQNRTGLTLFHYQLQWKKEEWTKGWNIDFSTIFHAVINLSVGYFGEEIIKMHMV